jgi:O-antigen/teichoic acid export membrane protein
LNKIKSLANQTIIYGLSTVVPRFINFLLVPVITWQFKEQAEYGVVTYIYALISFSLVFLLFGLETAFFRFASRNDEKDVLSGAFSITLSVSVLFLVFFTLFRNNIASILQYSDKKIYLTYFSAIIFFDVINSIPFAYLRYKEKSIKFSMIKIIAVLLNIGILLFLLFIVPTMNNKLFGFGIEKSIGFIFIANVIASAVTSLMLIKEIVKIPIKFDTRLQKKLIKYGLPLMIAGLAGIANDLIDRILMNYLLPDTIKMSQIGIYGAVAKLAVIIVLFNQMFRYAFEPFFFKLRENEERKELLGTVAKYYVAVSGLVLLMVLLYIDYFKYFIGNAYWEGLDVVAIILFANMFVGIQINLSAWYKIKDLTKFAIVITAIGAAVNIAANIIFIPTYGYHACAWSRLVSYFIIVCVSYLISRKYYPIKYDLKRITGYIALCYVIYIISNKYLLNNQLKDVYNALLILFYIFVIERSEKGLIKRIIR